MAKRFIDTGYFQSPFVRGLEGGMKSLYNYIICSCSPAGVWAVDLEVAGIYTGFKFEKAMVEKSFLATGKAIDLEDGKWFFPGFIEHQYPSGISEKNPAHKSIISELSKYQLLSLETKGSTYSLQLPSKGTKVMVTDKVMGKVEVMDTVTEKVKEPKIEKSDSLLQAMEKLWDAHLIKEKDISYYANGAERKALKEIGSKLLHQCNEKLRRENIIDDRPDDEKILEAWQYVLNNFSKWSDFNQQFTKLNQINGQFTNIIGEIKSIKKPSKHDREQERVAGLDKLKETARNLAMDETQRRNGNSQTSQE